MGSFAVQYARRVLRYAGRRDVPWEPMSIRVILRPKNVPSYYLGAALLELARELSACATTIVRRQQPKADTRAWLKRA